MLEDQRAKERQKHLPQQGILKHMEWDLNTVKIKKGLLENSQSLSQSVNSLVKKHPSSFLLPFLVEPHFFFTCVEKPSFPKIFLLFQILHILSFLTTDNSPAITHSDFHHRQLCQKQKHIPWPQPGGRALPFHAVHAMHESGEAPHEQTHGPVQQSIAGILVCS